MARAYSIDLRDRVVSAVERDGLSRHQAAARFGVAVSTAVKWLQRFHRTGSAAPGQMGGHKPKSIAGGHRDWLIERSGAGFYTAWIGGGAGRAWSQGRLPFGVGVRSHREAEL